METEFIPPTTLKPTPVTVAWEIMTAAVPVFERVNVCDVLEPDGTFPKLKFVAFAAIVPDGVPPELVFAGAPALVKPTQPEIVNVVSSIARMVNKASGLCRFGTSVATGK